jgi:hypothetical protein
MGKPTTFVTSVVVALALAWPVAAGAQVRSRSGGGSSSGGSSSGTATRSGSGGSAAPRVAVPRSSAPRSPAPSPSSTSSRSSARVGSSSSGSRPAAPQAAGGSGVRSSAGGGSAMGSANTRTRGVRAIEGYAQARDSSNPGWYYSPGLSSHFGYIALNPWRYSLSSWSRARYGGWYTPYGYPYGYGYGYSYGYPYGFGSYWGPSYYYGVDDREVEPDTGLEYGSLRLRASPKSARVYVDGALAGIVDDFDGLSSHLELVAGIHQIELRADGYETYTAEVEVEAGRTRTERASLDRID